MPESTTAVIDTQKPVNPKTETAMRALTLEESTVANFWFQRLVPNSQVSSERFATLIGERHPHQPARVKVIENYDRKELQLPRGDR